MVKFATLATAAVVAASLPFATADMVKRAPQDSSSSSSSKHHHHHHSSGSHHKATATVRAAVENAASGSATIASNDASVPASLSSIIATISSGLPTSTPSYALSTTFTAGAQNTFISNAPALPAATAARPTDFPTLDVVPPSDSAQAKKWLAQYADQLKEVPDIPVTTDQASCASNPENLANAAANHWWTCGGYTTDTDVTECPDQNVWGLSYDDGPSPYTPKLLDYFEKHGDIKSTFFVVGSRALSRPDMLQYEYMKGHQLSVHTWSHTALTTQTNEQVLLELAWTKEVIRQITGVTPNTMRPPYGDIDDRVRAICKMLDLTPIIWTSLSQEATFDTNDWKIQSGVVSVAEVVSTFDSILDQVPTLDHGYIVLEHDLYQQSVDLAVSVVLPQAQAMSPKQTLLPIVRCLNKDLSEAYIETSSNTTSAAATGTASSGGSGSTGKSGSSSSSTSTSDGVSVRLPALALLGSLCLSAAIVL